MLTEALCRPIRKEDLLQFLQLTPADNLPKVAHVEQDGMFRFGRALIDEEKIIHRERAVLAGFENALAAARTLYPELT